ncbi:class I SAM-dependent methyltransferase [Aestuariispira insulae]|uniref:Methyltransferase family protein n=1 Tax=Aestuariispira insulae TaxID=1461337 RepID=A0A3D9HNC2_9PROT|nr:class I SAM-dependent methyltransferase [Aestuariispira insulae]RED51007.1 hypothetical protein DFP90_104283 [Aestuariispira insulae]
MSVNTSSSFIDSAREIREKIGGEYELLAGFFDSFARDADWQKLQELENTYLTVQPEKLSEPTFMDSDEPDRFFMMVSWFVNKYRILHSLGLQSAEPCRILDLGSGPGHFLALAKFAGHEAVGLDREDPFFSEMSEFLNVERKEAEIAPNTPLPNLGQFDLVSAQNIAFHINSEEERCWNEEEWIFFLRDLSENCLNDNGRILLQFKKEAPLKDGLSLEDKSLPRFMRRMGAHFLEDDSGLGVTYFAVFTELDKLRQKLMMFG